MEFNDFLKHSNIYNANIYKEFENFNHSKLLKQVPNWRNVQSLLAENLEADALDACNGFSWITLTKETRDHLSEMKLMCFGLGDFQLTRTDRRLYDNKVDMQIIMSVLGNKIYFDSYDRVLQQEVASCCLLTFSDSHELLSLDTVYQNVRRHYDAALSKGITQSTEESVEKINLIKNCNLENSENE